MDSPILGTLSFPNSTSELFGWLPTALTSSSGTGGLITRSAAHSFAGAGAGTATLAVPLSTAPDAAFAQGMRTQAGALYGRVTSVVDLQVATRCWFPLAIGAAPRVVHSCTVCRAAHARRGSAWWRRAGAASDHIGAAYDAHGLFDTAAHRPRAAEEVNNLTSARR